ncbi:hypothetical protein F4775DRAFT_223462 [Biscogniauxia sp. FL1348]|nr:hypothetical protein F4775DRAFT_223462 [Biscogniauxia sp. FL1348]
MFACKACRSRVLQVFIDHASASLTQAAGTTTLRPPVVLAGAKSHQPRPYATAAITAPAPSHKDAPSRRSSTQIQREWAARKHLQYLKDPLQISEHVRRTLEKGQFEEAVSVVRNASRNTKVTVSWNYLIDYQLRADRIHAALKLFNEMKKRAQLPNAHTYTIIFRGCARSAHGTLAVLEALRLYNNMISRERIKPNTLHMNAVLQVCAKAKDIESLFSVIQTADEGMRAPNNLTYTTIFNALRAQATEPVQGGLEDAEVREAREKVIRQARTIWEEVVSRWRSGALIIDEELVCAMGRILLIGGYKDADLVETLIEQTMNIPRDTNNRLKGDTKDTLGDDQSDEKAEVAAASAHQENKSPNAPEVPYAKPGNNSLSMILASLQKTGRTTRAIRYWGIFTKNYGVVPDKENWSQLFTTFALGRSSARTIGYLERMPKHLMEPKHFRIAMGACLRDNINHSAFRHATRVLEIMLTNITIPDVPVLRRYLHVAYANKHLFEEQSKTDYKAAMMGWGKQITVALDNLWNPYVIASKQLVYEPKAAKSDVVVLARKMISACDKLINEKLIAPDALKRITKYRGNLNRFVVKYFESQFQHDPASKDKDQEGLKLDIEENEEDEDEEGEVEVQDEGHDYFGGRVDRERR